MKRFRYLRDELFLVSCALYALNRWVLEPHYAAAFLHSHFNDLFLIPCALPPLLFLHRRLRLREHDAPPTTGEILMHVSLWSVICEVLGPALSVSITGDWRDVLAYGAGALFAGVWWNWRGRAAARCAA